jgi:hypothetical protein
MGKSLKKPSPAMIVACLALFVASAGTSIAASHYLITSTKQIKPSVLKQLKGAQGPKGQGVPGDVGPQGPKGDTGATGTPGAKGDKGDTGTTGTPGAKGDKGDTGLTGATGPAGPTGPIGPRGVNGDDGATGATGPAGPAGSTMIESPVVVSALGAPSGTGITATVTCPAGKVLLGGGGATSNGDADGKTALTGSYPSNTTTWVVQGVVITTLNSGARMYAYAYAFCSL